MMRNYMFILRATREIKGSPNGAEEESLVRCEPFYFGTIEGFGQRLGKDIERIKKFQAQISHGEFDRVFITHHEVQPNGSFVNFSWDPLGLKIDETTEIFADHVFIGCEEVEFDTVVDAIELAAAAQ